MDGAAIGTEIRRYLTEELLLAEAALAGDLAEAGLDSLGLVDLVGFLESRFSVVLAPEDCLSESFRTLPAIVATVATARPAP